jgi:hypothetical protein
MKKDMSFGGIDTVDGIVCGKRLRKEGDERKTVCSQGLQVNDHEGRNFEFAPLKLVGEYNVFNCD